MPRSTHARTQLASVRRLHRSGEDDRHPHARIDRCPSAPRRAARQRENHRSRRRTASPLCTAGCQVGPDTFAALPSSMPVGDGGDRPASVPQGDRLRSPRPPGDTTSPWRENRWLAARLGESTDRCNRGRTGCRTEAQRGPCANENHGGPNSTTGVDHPASHTIEQRTAVIGERADPDFADNP